MLDQINEFHKTNHTIGRKSDPNYERYRMFVKYTRTIEFQISERLKDHENAVDIHNENKAIKFLKEEELRQRKERIQIKIDKLKQNEP